jgi:hypothetical protein
VKQRVESELHQAAHLAIFAEEVEKAVDGICAEVCREITGLCDRESSLGELLTSRDEDRLDRLESARRDSHASILHAYTTLYQTQSELIGFKPEVRSVARVESGTERRLPELIRDLRDEAETRGRTRVRISEAIGGMGSGARSEVALETAGAIVDEASGPDRRHCGEACRARIRARSAPTGGRGWEPSS